MNKSIAVTLDSLFDVRLSLLEHFGYDIDIKNYLTRENDNFKYLGDTFKNMYIRRNTALFKNSLLTSITELIKLYIIDLRQDILLNDLNSEVIVKVINNKYNFYGFEVPFQ